MSVFNNRNLFDCCNLQVPGLFLLLHWFRNRFWFLGHHHWLRAWLWNSWFFGGRGFCFWWRRFFWFFCGIFDDNFRYGLGFWLSRFSFWLWFLFSFRLGFWLHELRFGLRFRFRSKLLPPRREQCRTNRNGI